MTRRTAIVSIALVALALLASSCSEGRVVQRSVGAASRQAARPVSGFDLGDRLTRAGQHAGFAVDREGAVVQVDDSTIGAFDARGHKRWTSQVAGAAYGWPWLGHDIAVVATVSADRWHQSDAGPGGCVALDRSTGRPRWAYEEVHRNGVAVSGFGDRVYCAFGDGTIVALDANTGARIWRVQTRTDVLTDEIEVRERTAIVVDATSQRLVYVVRGGDQWFLDMRDLATGAIWGTWSLPHTMPSSSPTPIGPGRVVVATGSAQVCVFDVKRGIVVSCVDNVPAPDGFDSASVPVVTADGQVIVAAREGSVSAVDLQSEKVVWTAHVDRPLFDVRPAVAADEVVVVDMTEQTHGLRLSDGSSVPVPKVDGFTRPTG